MGGQKKQLDKEKKYLVVNIKKGDKRFSTFVNDCIFIHEGQVKGESDALIELLTDGWRGKIFVVLPRRIQREDKDVLESVTCMAASEEIEVNVVLPGKDLLTDVAMSFIGLERFGEFLRFLDER